MTCPICIESVSEPPSICISDIHYCDANCFPSKIHKTSCGHVYHHCCWYSYVYVKTGMDTDGECGQVVCPLCRQMDDVYVSFTESKKEPPKK